MSFGNSNMAGSVLGAAFSLLLLASIIQGFQVGAVLQYDEDAAVGQNITLQCSFKNYTDLKVFNIEWRKKNGGKLAIYNSIHGEYLFQPNVSLQVKNNDANQTVICYLHLPELKKQDSGTYFCDISTFPLGAFRTEIKLTIEDERTIECNLKNTIEVYNGENVTIDCNTSFPNAQYRWAKNTNVMSDNESLKLWMVTDADAGIYTLTVITGRKTLNKEFIVIVLPAATSSRTDISTASSQHPNETTIGNLETTSVINTDSESTSSVTTAREELSTTPINSPYTTVTPSPAPRSDISLFNTTTPSDGRTTTQEMRRSQTELYTPHTQDTLSTRPEESSSFGDVSGKSEKPEATQTVSKEGKTTVTEETVADRKDTEQGHLFLLLIIIPVLLLIAVAGILYRRQVMKSRMDLPPPFKPPPPPVKYTAPRRTETQPFHT